MSTIPASERERIARTYGVLVERIPERITVCPPQTFAHDATQTYHWREGIGQHRTAAARQRRFADAEDRTARDNRYRDMAAREFTLGQMAAEMGVSKDTVRDHLKRLGLQAKPAYHGGQWATDPDDLRRMVADGLTIRQISERTGRSYKAIRMALARLGLKARSTKRKPDMDAVRRFHEAERERQREEWRQWAETMTAAEIAAQTGRAVNSVRRTLDRLGLKALPAKGDTK